MLPVELTDALDNISKIGFTAAAITQLCKELSVPIHIKWGGCKIESYTPEHTQYDAVALYIWGDHAFTVGDAAIKRAIIREPVSESKSQDRNCSNNLKNSQFYTSESILGYIH